MSQNKTVFPGLGKEGDFTPHSGYPGNNQPYSRPSNQGRGKGTVYPSMEMPTGQQQTTTQHQQNNPKTNGKPIVGFLYSISRTGVGEYWPLHVGQNIIGNASDCDIVLGEGTVSQRHANLHINKMKKPEKTEATISDLGSTNGTQVNENSVSMARPVECVNGDIITIGENYDLLLLLIDTKEIGLHLSENFIDVSDEQDDVFPGGFTQERDNSTRNEQDFPPRFSSRAFDPRDPDFPRPNFHYDSESRPTDSTVGMNSDGGFKRGGTTGMD